MADLLIRNVDPEVLRSIDAIAQDLGLSRNEFLRREVARIAGAGSRAATHEDLKRSLELLADLADEKVMRQAWG